MKIAVPFNPLRGIELYQTAINKSAYPHPIMVGRLAHYALASVAGDVMQVDDMYDTLEPYLDRRLQLDDLTGHIGSDPIEFTPASIVLQRFHMSDNYGSNSYVRLYVPDIPHPYLPDVYRQFTFRMDRNGYPTFQVYAQTSF